jgi:hypothetical protein
MPFSLKHVVAGCLVTVFAAGCAPGSATQTPTLYVFPTLAGDSGGASAIPPAFGLTPTQNIAVPQSACEHLFWPLRDGASWTYRTSAIAGAQPEVIFQSTIALDGVQLTLGDDSSHLNCIDGALAGLPPGWIGSGHPALGGGVIGLNPAGAFLASEDALLSFEGAWQLDITPSGTILLPIPASTPVQISGGEMFVYSVPLPTESVTVPAGSFTALPIQQDFLYQITVTLPDGSAQDVFINTTVKQYFVERVGLVRAEFVGGTISSSDGSISAILDSGSILELVQYSIP